MNAYLVRGERYHRIMSDDGLPHPSEALTLVGDRRAAGPRDRDAPAGRRHPRRTPTTASATSAFSPATAASSTQPTSPRR